MLKGQRSQGNLTAVPDAVGHPKDARHASVPILSHVARASPRSKWETFDGAVASIFGKQTGYSSILYTYLKNHIYKYKFVYATCFILSKRQTAMDVWMQG